MTPEGTSPASVGRVGKPMASAGHLRRDSSTILLHNGVQASQVHAVLLTLAARNSEMTSMAYSPCNDKSSGTSVSIKKN